MIELLTSDWDVRLDPKDGSCFHKARYRNFDLFRPLSGKSDDSFTPFICSHFPMLPFSNRIRNGQFEFDGKRVKLPINAPDQRHPLHGLGWTQPWEIIRQTDHDCKLAFEHTGPSWPWCFSASQTISVQDNMLKLELSLTNQDESPMPSGLGFHPYFASPATATLQFKSDGIWLPDSELLPNAAVKTPRKMDFNAALSLKDLKLDHCYIGAGPNYSLRWEDHNYGVDIATSESLKWAAVYISQRDNCFCVEPVSHAHNALNMEDPLANGLVILQPGETHACWAEFTVTR